MSYPLALSFMGNLIVGLFVLVCAALILIVLLQKGRGGGIGAAFGGGGAGSLLGTKTGDFLTWVTICLVALFLVLSVLMGKFMRPTGTSGLSAPLAAPAAAPAPEGTTPEGTTTPAEETATETPAAEQVDQPAPDDAQPAAEPSN